jgi:hypothetical protein
MKKKVVLVAFSLVILFLLPSIYAVEFNVQSDTYEKNGYSYARV